MRTLSATLLDAQKSDSHVPYLKVVATNKMAGIVRLKWDRLYEGTEPDYYHAVTALDDGSLIRVRIGPAEDNNKLYRQRAVNPGPQSDFSVWTYAGQYGCQAVTVTSLGAEVVIFWVNLNQELKYLKSTDYGTTWSSAIILDYSPYAVVEGISAAYKPNGDMAVFFTCENTLYVKKRINGNWQAKSAWNHNTGYLNSVAVVYEGDWNLIIAGRDSSGNYMVWSLVYGDGNLVPSGEFSELKGMASAPAGGKYEFRSVYLDEPDIFRGSYLEKFSGVQSYNRPYITTGIPDVGFLSGLWCEPVPFDFTSEYGIAMTHSGNCCWLSTPCGVWHAVISEQNLDLTDDITDVRLEINPTGGSIALELRNDNGEYAYPGTGNLVILDTGCQLDISPGYITSQGKEVSDGFSFWLETYEHISSGGKAGFKLYAIDGWYLLGSWNARYQFRWNSDAEELSVKKILEFVLGRIGLKLEVKSESPTVTGFYPDFMIHPGDSGISIVKRLLSFVPDVLFIEGMKAYLVNPQSSDGSVYSYGQSHVIFEGKYDIGALGKNQIHIEGYDTATGTPLSYNSTDWAQAEKFPERFELVIDKNIGTVSQAESRVTALQRELEIKATGGFIVIPVNCGQQLYDVVDITDIRAGMLAVKRRVSGIVLVYQLKKGSYFHRLTLGGV